MATLKVKLSEGPARFVDEEFLARTGFKRSEVPLCECSASPYQHTHDPDAGFYHETQISDTYVTLEED